MVTAFASSVLEKGVGLLLKRPQPKAAAIGARLEKLRNEVARAKAERAAGLERRKDFLLRGSDDELAKFDAETRLLFEQIDRRIRDGEYLLPILAEEFENAVQSEKNAADAALRKDEYASCQARVEAFDRKLLAEGLPAFAVIIALVGEERELSEIVGNTNCNLPAGAKPLEPPGRSVRFSPPIPGRRETRKVKRTRIKESQRKIKHSAGGPDRYEICEAEEEFIVGAEPAFDPAPLYRTVEIPALRKGDPAYRIPWNWKT